MVSAASEEDSDREERVFRLRKRAKETRARVQWTYCETLLWIAFRDELAVAYFTDGWVAEDLVPYPFFPCTANQVEDYVDRVIRSPRDTPGVWEQALQTLGRDPAIVDTDPQRSLLVSLKGGAVIAQGRHPTLDSLLADIPAGEWRSLYLGSGPPVDWGREREDHVNAHLSGAGEVEGAAWWDVGFVQDSVLRAFPSLSGSDSVEIVGTSATPPAAEKRGAVRRPSKAVQFRQLKAWLQERQRNGDEIPTRDEVVKKARAECWNIDEAKKNYPKIADKIGFPRRGPGEKPSRPRRPAI
jgi:hypothetical protein